VGYPDNPFSQALYCYAKHKTCRSGILSHPQQNDKLVHDI
jgi:hypothetical protein